MTQREEIHRLIDLVSGDGLEAVKASIEAIIADQRDGDQEAEGSRTEDATANMLYKRFCGDWGELSKHLNEVEDCLFPKQKFIDILLNSKFDRSLFKQNIKARRAMALAVRDLVLLLQYSDVKRIDFELDTGFHFESGTYSAFFEYLGSPIEEDESQAKLE